MSSECLLRKDEPCAPRKKPKKPHRTVTTSKPSSSSSSEGKKSSTRSAANEAKSEVGGKAVNARQKPAPEGKDEKDLADDKERWWVESCEKKRMFICCDGTWQNASGTLSPLTNVAKLARAVARLGRDDYQPKKPDNEKKVEKAAELKELRDLDPEDLEPKVERVGVVRQLVYYSSGIGGQTALNIERGYTGFTGKGLESNILNAYCFICNNYNFRSKKDEIILVGFSRGAFTVRCLANFIDKVGLLRRKGLHLLRPLFESWKTWGRAKGQNQQDLEEKLKEKVASLGDLFRTGVKISILAEWDTVSAIGLPLGLWTEKFSFVNDTAPPKCVENALFALAMDEKRRSFKPRQWKERLGSDTNVEQCAFVGCHSDIGGGNPDVGLSTLSLIWMISKIRACSEAEFDEGTLLQFMFPVEPERGLLALKALSWATPKMELKNFAGTQGPIHESFRGWWRIPWLLSLGLWHGKRDSIFDVAEGEGNTFKLKIHFTVGLLNNSSARRQLSKGHEHKTVSARGEENTQKKIQLEEDSISELESALLWEWIRLAERFRDQKALKQSLKDEDDVNWTRVAENLDLKPPDGNIEEKALVNIIQSELLARGLLCRSEREGQERARDAGAGPGPGQ